MNPWLSVIMPVHNGAHFLGMTLAAAAAEQPAGVEFLIYDSGEDDGAARRIAESFADRLDIRYQAAPDCKPWTAKTNRGVEEARAMQVAMLHQDDLWRAGHLAAVRRAIEAVPDAALSIGASRFISAAGTEIGTWRLPFASGPISGSDFAATLVVQNTIAIPSPVIRRDAWLACGGLDETLWYTADWDLYLKLAGRGPALVRPEVSTAFRVHGGSLTMTDSRKADEFRAQMEVVLQRHLPMVPARVRARQGRLARAAISANCALAMGSHGNWRGLLRGAGAILALGPLSLPQFLRETRLIDRTVPRVRLALAGSL